MEIYCTQLGMVAEFPYCLSVNEGKPCRNTIGCWRERMDMMNLLRAAFTEEESVRCFGGPPKTRMKRITESLSSAVRED